jgi:hypothetical protein
MFIPSISTTRYLKPHHRSMFAVDVTSFGCRNPRLGLLSRQTLYAIVQEACDAAGICWHCCYHEDRGDAILALAPADESIETLIDPFVTLVTAGLDGHNRVLSSDARIQLRMAIHAGYVYSDPHGISGRAIIHLFRLLEAPALKARLAHCHDDFGLIVSDYLYEEIVEYSPGQIDAELFQPVNVDVKETRSRGWIWLPSTARPGSSVKTAVQVEQSHHLAVERSGSHSGRRPRPSGTSRAQCRGARAKGAAGRRATS